MKSPPPLNSPHAGAFTLIELAAALVVMALLAAAVTASLYGKESRIRMQDVVSQWKDYENQNREHARRFGKPALLVVDLVQQRVTRLDAATQEKSTATLALPQGFAITEIRMRQIAIRSGEVSIPCSSQGRTPTYGVLMTGPDGQSSRWLVTGLTGDILPLTDQEELESALNQLVPLPLGK